jgi:hypothetical protein
MSPQWRFKEVEDEDDVERIITAPGQWFAERNLKVKVGVIE